MTDLKVRQIIDEQVSAAVAALKKEKCPHCGVAIGANKVVKVKSVTEDFFDQFYGADPLPTLPQSASGGLFK